MMSTLATIVIIVVFLVLTYAGARDGAYFSAYVLVRNCLAFICSVTFFQQLGSLLTGTISRRPPAPEYFDAMAFVAIFGIVLGVGRWLKVKYTFPQVDCPVWLERVGGVSFGVLNAIILTGTILVMWSMVPVAPYIPGDGGRAYVKARAFDTGPAVLKFYDFMTRRIPGGAVFLYDDEPVPQDANGNGRADPGDGFEDTNGNGRWDRGWLWKYRNHADIWPSRVQRIILQTPDTSAAPPRR